jgi:hypothetical protein
VVGFFEPTTRLMSICQVSVLLTSSSQLTVLRPQAVVNGADRGVGVRGEVNSSKVSRERDEGSDKTGVLVRVAIVLLSPKGTGLNVGETSNVASPLGFESHLHKLGVLLNHRGNDTEETGCQFAISWVQRSLPLVRGEESMSTSQGVTLHPTLEGVLR